jgi:hypothetical protein
VLFLEYLISHVEPRKLAGLMRVLPVQVCHDSEVSRILWNFVVYG